MFFIKYLLISRVSITSILSKNYIHIHLVQFPSHNHLKNLLKYFPNILNMHLIRNIFLQTDVLLLY